MLRKAVFAICAAVCGAQAEVSLANDTESIFNAEAARGQLAGVAKGKETSAITLRSGMAAREECVVAVRYGFDRKVAVEKKTVEAVPSNFPVKMLEVDISMHTQAMMDCNIAVAQVINIFTVRFQCNDGTQAVVQHSGTQISVELDWKIVLSFSSNIFAVHTQQEGGDGSIIISTESGSSTYINSASLISNEKFDLKFKASAEKNQACTGKTCVDGPAKYASHSVAHPFPKVSDLKLSTANSTVLCINKIY